MGYVYPNRIWRIVLLVKQIGSEFNVNIAGPMKDKVHIHVWSNCRYILPYTCIHGSWATYLQLQLVLIYEIVNREKTVIFW